MKLGPFDGGPGAASDAQLRVLYRMAWQRLGASANGDDVLRALNAHFGTSYTMLLEITRDQANEWADAMDSVRHPEYWPGEKERVGR